MTMATSSKNGRLQRVWLAVVQWFDADALSTTSTGESRSVADSQDDMRIDWLRCIPFLIVHLGCLGVFYVGWSPAALIACLLAFWVRMFAITAFYHRFFSHRSFKANRAWQLVFAILGNTAAQRGPLWWASHHRAHHRHADSAEDIHSPIQHSFFWSHIAWFMSKKGYRTDYSKVKDLARFPELRFLNRFDSLVPVLFGCLLFALGGWLESAVPEWGVTAGQMLVWGFFISTVLLFHATFTINSLGHLWGKRRFETKDHSRNNPWLAFLTLGEGWHNNHHRFAVSARQGFYWYEIDISYAVLKLMSWLGIVRELNPVPSRVLQEGRAADLERKRLKQARST